jgi:hypothetical protein
MEMKMFPRHPDDEETFRSGTWADDFNTYEDACRYYGCDTPAQIEAEAQWHHEEACIEQQDELETRCHHVHPYGAGEYGLYWGALAFLNPDPQPRIILDPGFAYDDDCPF